MRNEKFFIPNSIYITHKSLTDEGIYSRGKE